MDIQTTYSDFPETALLCFCSKTNIANKVDEEKNTNPQQKQKLNTNLASKRPIQNPQETLDIEPLNEKNLVTDNKELENFEIDDPW